MLLSAAVDVPFGPAVSDSGGADLAVTLTPGASFASSARSLAAVPAPTITSISPAAGELLGGTEVVITGTNLLGATGVTFGSRAGTIVSVTDTEMVVNSPKFRPSTVHVRVQRGSRSSVGTSADRFVYTRVPVVSSLSEKAGPLTGGTLVTIKGSNLLGAEVSFGTVPATILSNTAKQIVAVSPAGEVGQVSVTVETAGGTSVIKKAGRFSYVAAPTVTGISPVAGPSSGHAKVTITGTNLKGAESVNFGTAAAKITKRSDTQIVVTSPAGAAGTVDITVATAGGVSVISAADEYTYVPAPVITNLSTQAGPVAGGTTVTITGVNLLGATEVDFGSKEGVIVSNTDTEIVVTTPAGKAGTVKVKVETSGGESAISSDDRFTYVAMPRVNGISPRAGALGGGATVTITGVNLLNATAVNFGLNAGTIISVTAKKIVVTSPAGLAGDVDVTVVTAGGTSAVSDADVFTYVDAPAVTGIAPSTGPLAGGTTVTITGTDLLGAASVHFGAALGTIVSGTDTQLVVISPAGAAGIVDITVTTVGGTSATSADDEFTYADEV